MWGGRYRASFCWVWYLVGLGLGILGEIFR